MSLASSVVKRVDAITVNFIDLFRSSKLNEIYETYNFKISLTRHNHNCLQCLSTFLVVALDSFPNIITKTSLKMKYEYTTIVKMLRKIKIVL